MFRLTVFFSLSVNGSTSLKAIMHQITESVSEFIYFAMMRKNIICSQNETTRANYFQINKAEFTSADTRQIHTDVEFTLEWYGTGGIFGEQNCFYIVNIILNQVLWLLSFTIHNTESQLLGPAVKKNISVCGWDWILRNDHVKTSTSVKQT